MCVNSNSSFPLESKSEKQRITYINELITEYKNWKISPVSPVVTRLSDFSGLCVDVTDDRHLWSVNGNVSSRPKLRWFEEGPIVSSDY